jgi:PHD/YefM family antitoxin component YafN of YafNO toxin-antitoxin module
MQSFTLTDIHDRYDEVFEQAAAEPILLTQESQPSYVLLSIHDYQKLIERLADMEDQALGKLAELTLSQSHLVGTEIFTTELTRLAALDHSNL